MPTRVPWQCGLCGAFIKRGPKGTCQRCGTSWDNGEANPRQKHDDDGQEYADPRDWKAGRE